MENILDAVSQNIARIKNEMKTATGVDYQDLLEELNDERDYIKFLTGNYFGE